MAFEQLSISFWVFGGGGGFYKISLFFADFMGMDPRL